MLVKICGITTPEMARKVAWWEDYIGLLFYQTFLHVKLIWRQPNNQL